MARRLKSIRALVILIGQRIPFSMDRYVSELLFILGNDKFNTRLVTLTSISIFGDYKQIR